ncbi:hypothetical protein Asp14428_25650 [Actinoplanes sp. NBRC 14428]|nr:hypothetical protein Asp14428_25650 [Actinoplanes sp. NBRC 14428]
MSRVVVIGAGVGGLAAAIRLAAAGHEVTVHERATDVGGKLGRYERDGFLFDTGPSLLTLPRVFTDLGLTLDPVALDPVVRHVFPDGRTLDSSPDPAVFAGRIAEALGAGAAADWARFWRRAERIWAASWRSVLQREVSPASLARLSWRVGDLAAIAPGRSLRALGRRYLRDWRLRMLLDRYATYTGTDPRRAPAALAAIPYAELAFGGWYLPGGLGVLGTALLDRCAALGVTIRTSSTVTGIRTGDGRVTGVDLDSGAGSPADVVVSDVDAATLYRELLPTPGRLAALADRSLAGFVLLLGVRGETPQLAHHTVFFPRDYDAEFDAVFGDPGHGRRAHPPSDPTVFVTRAADPAVHPPGAEAWFVLVNAPATARRPARSTGGGPASRRRTAATSSTCWPPAASTSATGSRSWRPAPRRTSPTPPRHPAARSTARRAGSCDRPTADRSTVCTWWAARPTPAAACRWSPCRRRSSRTPSARPDR